MILSIVSGLLIWLILHKMSARFRNKAWTLYLIIIVPIAIISFMSTFLRIEDYQISILYCNFYLPLSYPLEITNCSDIMPSDPTTFIYYFIFFGFRIHIFDIVNTIIHPFIVLLFLGFFLFVLNFLSTGFTLFCIKKIVTSKKVAKDI